VGALAQVATEPTQAAPAKRVTGKRKKWRPVKIPSRFEALLDPGFAAEIAADVPDGEDLRACIQCGTCAGTCPMILYMDLAPRRIIGMIREGARDDVVHSTTPWVCASCYSCTVECPKQIPITGIMHALRRIALREKTYPRGLPVPLMEREFVNVIEKRGRSTESWIAMKMYVRTEPTQLLRHIPLGLRLMRRGRMGFGRESIRDRAQLRALLRAVDEQPRKSAAPTSRAPGVPTPGTGGAS
jgi:heterodisulfide reductase subunit C